MATKKIFLFASLFAAAFSFPLHAQFTTGNVVVLQVGDGTEALSNAGNSLFLKEFTPAGGNGISVTIPDNGAGALLNSGTATSEGQITLSSDGKLILIPGYNTAYPFPSPIASSSSATVPRAIGQVDGFGTYSFVASSPSFFSGNNIRSATGDGNNNYWASGANSGLCYYATGTPAAVSTTVNNERVAHLCNGNLMFSTGSGTPSVYTLPGAPTAGPVIASIAVSIAGGSPYGFAVDPGNTTLYIADDRTFSSTAAQAGGIEKYTWNGSAWIFQYTLQCGAGTFGARGLTVDFSGANPVIYATTTETTSNRLISITDVGASSGSSALVLSTAPAGTVYRGVVFSPCAPVSISSLSTNSPVCEGATLHLSSSTGGSPAYTYSWSGPNSFSSGQQNPAITNAHISSGGTYTLTVTNACGTSTQNISVTIIPSPSVTLTSSTDELCNGDSNGTAAVSASGGNPGYTYNWTPSGGTNASASGLGAGTYTCTVSDMSNCSSTQTVTITEPAALSASIISSSDVTCNGSNDGQASVSVTGGTSAYSYAWTPSGGNAAGASGLSPNNYTCNITDANGCTTSASVVITEPVALSVAFSQTNNTCANANDGSATVSPGGGTGPYTYSWSSGGTNATETNLAAGSYTCTITDAHSCTITQSFTITQPSALTSSVTAVTNVTCNGNGDGSATVSASGGTSSYSYAWTPSGGNTATASSLPVGNYTCTVTDANGCTTTSSVSITQPSTLASSLSSQANVSCNGGSDGTATVAVSGGAPSYNYSWMPSGGNSATAPSLAQGSYTCTITDANGCSVTTSVSITEPAALTVTNAQNNVSCNGGNNGAASVSVNGGTPSYTYAWLPSGGSSDTASSLPQGNYTCTITDANGCTVTSSVSITEPAALSSSVTATTNVSCNSGNDGAATVSANGGTPSYSYSWSPSGGNAAAATSLPQGNYTCTITDANGCSTTASLSITEPAALTSSVTSTTNVSCNSGNNGSATIAAGGGTPSYSYAWTPSGGSAATAASLSQGNYTCTITDANGCTATASVSITQPSAITTSV
ncbi:MAG TPA: hypothetical protein VFU15_00885, partial [Bacteroidia bacterium]|nr:hypothetical protein [Bacteroidia bacterium]